jgi:ABC-type branched-subunit amino acid transport system ATPase component
MTEPLLRLQSLSKKFGSLIVTDNITLDFAAGEMHAIIGPNGAGKTTLINQIGATGTARAARSRPQLSDHVDPTGIFGPGKRRARGAGPHRLELALLRPRRR